MTGQSNISLEPREIYLLGIGTGHSVGPPMHNYIAKSLGLPWTYHTKECPSIEECLALLRSKKCAGAAITMPFKHTVLAHLDEYDDLAKTLNACNTVTHTTDDRLIGSSLDWCGIAGALQESSVGLDEPAQKIGLVIGAGGAARAAVYALATEMGCSTIYILNRDVQEVLDLQADVEAHYVRKPSIVHLLAEEQLAGSATPTYIVGTVPDFEPSTNEEKTVKAILAAVLARPEKGVLLDMCYRPRRTRHIQLGEQHGWRTIEGIHVVGHQAEHQWRAWAGEERVKKLDNDGLWRELRKAADESSLVTPKM
ncbi:hypothetical protein M409DRAFT_37827 [Zasmidium cellare ATCC 36951]|uniref:Shikimate dehydrogenase substrate binding N-terminal domain-containing protein n=1 Tax=Zasmidium cellare ATCC 36951 TaxID=1080233 RepID=A0A6A6C2K5_ZASCE|nr:uncharacterized protein M409DRAFT_37827 [Zasmidium cellare ATCC 36951]KAF2159959.1 hypothetical protein M409DRAFT_37827 [Zasmidium cellare ATCC 36951]